MIRSIIALLTACAVSIWPNTSSARTADRPASQVITLGTMAGPLADPTRAQPATLLRWDGGMVLVDAGDGAAGQLAKAGVQLANLRSIVLTHVHADHTGGLYAILATRLQVMLPPITIYGPPGTRRLVSGLLTALAPLSELGLAMPGRPPRDPAASVKVVEIGDGSEVQVEGIKVRAATNSHYLMNGHSPDPSQAQSLSLRFELPGRSVAITGDTGPSQAVAALARDADVLVSEIIDVPETIAHLRANYPSFPEAAMAAAAAHFAEQHLIAAEVGKLARSSGVKRLVVTHIAMPRSALKAARRAIARHYQGPVDFAEDLNSF